VFADSEIRNPQSAIRNPSWRVSTVLEQSGLLPLHVQRVLDALIAKHGEFPPPTLAEEIVLARQTLLGLWPKLPATGESDGGPHVLIGPAGAGKTTCICKWLTQARLVEGRTAFVWRLDGATANAAESLSVYCEILGVPSERTWNGVDTSEQADLSFIDLPGVDWRSPAALRELRRQVESFSPARVHLVLNAAYEVPLLLGQARAFSTLPVDDLILTHLDEETRWGKIWNVTLGTNVPVRYLSAAQNVPGEFFPATAEKILQRQFPA
jgi:flagellar biosynthesis protein FlhF